MRITQGYFNVLYYLRNKIFRSRFYNEAVKIFDAENILLRGGIGHEHRTVKVKD